jgi:hypothetical protein
VSEQQSGNAFSALPRTTSEKPQPPQPPQPKAPQAPPQQPPASSAPPRTTPQLTNACSAQQRTTPEKLQPSGIDLLKKVLDQEEDKAYLKKSKWRPGKNLFDSVND